MKRLGFILMAMFSLVILANTVSAGSDCGSCAYKEVTEVMGVVYYQGDINDTVRYANVNVTCLHDGKYYSLKTKTNKYGAYLVTFSKYKCTYGDSITVSASKDGLTGLEDGVIYINDLKVCKLKVDVGVVNVPLVPEFGLIAGITTILGAVGVFFLVRKN